MLKTGRDHRNTTLLLLGHAMVSYPSSARVFRFSVSQFIQGKSHVE